MPTWPLALPLISAESALTIDAPRLDLFNFFVDVSEIIVEGIMAIVTLTTDFGDSDWFVGTMKGVMARICPELRMVDLNHRLPPGDIRAAAFNLMCSYAFFPRGTIHLVVVDPGVGGERAGLAVQTPHYRFVAPDNGVLSWALRQEPAAQARRLENRDFQLSQVSATFHGRDVFSPAAAHWARQDIFEQLGPEQPEMETIAWPEPRETPNAIEGRVLYIDRFGNALTNIPAQSVTLERQARIGGNHELPVQACYSAVPPGAGLAVTGSSGFLEIAVNQGSAAGQFNLQVGDPVWLG